MSDTIGRITVPTPTASGLTFPLISDFAYGMTREWPVIVHRFGLLQTKAEQRFQGGIGPRKFPFKRGDMSYVDRAALESFFESVQGSYQSFTYNAPNADYSTTPYSVIFETQPLSIAELVNASQTGFNFIECPNSPPTYPVNSTCLRFPSSTLQTALLGQVQQIIPLIHIRVRETAVADIYLSDRRCTVGGQLYLARVLKLGEGGSEVILSQDLKGSADNVSFSFGNADRVMTALANDTDLMYASVDLSLYHVNTGILLQLWKGFIIDFGSDGTAMFPVTCSDGFYQVTQQYPPKVTSRTCWKTFDDGLNCPFATEGSAAPAWNSTIVYQQGSLVTYNGLIYSAQLESLGQEPDTSPNWAVGCDYYFDSPNGCQVHGMDGFFGGHPLEPQGVAIKDNSTGFGGFFRNTVTATSIVSDTNWGNALPEIWCNQNIAGYGSGLSPAVFAFILNALVMDVRDEGDYFDVLGIVGAGPIGAFTIGGDSSGLLVTNADGFTYVVAPMADGFTAQGFKLAASGTSVSTNDNLGLRQVVGNDPSNAAAGIVNVSGSTVTWVSGQQFMGSMVGATIGLVKNTSILAAPYSYFIVASVNSPTQLTLTTAPGNANNLLYQFGESFSLGQGTPQVWGEEVAAGTAFVELRYPKPSGIAPTTPDSHSMTVPIAQGLTGRTWDADGNATDVPGLTNPFWIAVNCMLRAMGLAPRSTDSSGTKAAQLATFVLTSLFKGDGTGAAEIADTLVTPLLGNISGQEYQFQFQGALAQSKPFRDWLNEILSCCLGNFTWEFGALKLICRINASATDAFTLGNILYQSLKLKPIKATFEHLIVSYADVEYQYQANTAEYEDKTHAAYYGRSGVPLTANMHCVGGATVSQMSRIAAIRTREEVGGINQAEWLAARDASWKTTILALSTEVGQVVSMTHPDMPGGVGNFRIQKWTLYKDWSIEIQGKTVTDSMYDLATGPKPANVQPQPLPALFYPEPLGEWAPYQILADGSDALFPGEYTFDVALAYGTAQNGAPIPQVQATGVQPVTVFLAGAGAPVIGSISQSTIGGYIPGGVLYRISLCANDGNNASTPPAAIALVQVPAGTNTNSITLNSITWPGATGLVNATTFISAVDDLICASKLATLTPTGVGAQYTPTSITITGPLVRSTWGLPNPNVAELELKGKDLIHGGVLGAPIDSVFGNTIVAGQAADSTGVDNWAGRALAVIGRNSGSIPFQAYRCTAFDPSTGTFTTDRAPGTLQAGDVFVVCTLGQDNSANPYLISDPGLSNAANFDDSTGVPVSTPHSGLPVDGEIGNEIYVLRGTSRGMSAKVVSNTATSYTVDSPLPMDSTSVWIVVGSSWNATPAVANISNGNSTTATTLLMTVPNWANKSMWVAGFTIDVNGNEAPEEDAPGRMVYVFGSQGTRTVT